jgi:hypothetical protein
MPLRTSRDPDTLKTMSSVATEELIERAGRALIDAAPVPAKVILFGSRGR